MNGKSQSLEDMLAVLQTINKDETKREQSIHHSASCLLAAEGCVFGLTAVLTAALFVSEKKILSTADKVCLIAALGTLFASLIIAFLAQWHPSRDSITNSDNILVQMQESPESFQDHEQRLQYEMDMITKMNSDFQHDNTILNHRLRSSGITFLSGAGILAVTIAFILFGI